MGEKGEKCLREENPQEVGKRIPGSTLDWVEGGKEEKNLS